MHAGADSKDTTPGNGGAPELETRRRRHGGRELVRVNASPADYGQVQSFVEDVLDSRSVNRNIASETMLLLEAVFDAVVDHLGDDEAEVEISVDNRFGRTDVELSFAGGRFEPPDSGASDDPSAKMMRVLSERLSYSYRAGVNAVRISVCHSAGSYLLPNLVAVALAIVVSIPLYYLLGGDVKNHISSEFLTPLTKLFTNAVMMIGTPMTLFSLLKNTTDSFIVAGRGSSSRRLVVSSIATSLVAVLLATVFGFVVARITLGVTGVTDSVDIGLSSWSLSAAVDNIIPSNILAPFETLSPVPMIVVALLVTYALFSVGPSFDSLKKAIDACYDLFSRILHIVMAVFPAACFVLFLDLMLSDDFNDLINTVLMVVVVNVGIVVLLAFYAIRLKACGIGVRDFVRKLRPLVKENYAIGSVIDAVPYNIRYCAKNLGIPRERLEKELPVLAQTSLDGNCFIIMLLTMLYVFLCNCDVSWCNIAVAAVIVMFISFGAPNQPGSILIGMFIVFAYLDPNTAVVMALYFELFCGNNQNIINVISSVVTVAVNEARSVGDDSSLQASD